MRLAMETTTIVKKEEENIKITEKKKIKAIIGSRITPEGERRS